MSGQLCSRMCAGLTDKISVASWRPFVPCEFSSSSFRAFNLLNYRERTNSNQSLNPIEGIALGVERKEKEEWPRRRASSAAVSSSGTTWHSFGSGPWAPADATPPPSPTDHTSNSRKQSPEHIVHLDAKCIAHPLNNRQGRTEAFLFQALISK